MSKPQFGDPAGLEVDRTGADAPMTHKYHSDKASPATATMNHWQAVPANDGWQSSGVPPPECKSRKRALCGLAPATLYLSIALALVTILAAVGIGVAAHFAVQNGKSSANTAPSVCPTGNTTSPLGASSLGANASSPFSNCQTLGSQYTAGTESETAQVLDLKCGIDFVGYDLLGIYLSNFEDCMKACTSYNYFAGNTHNASTCGGVSFDTLIPTRGRATCWLKANQSTPYTPTSAITADSAKIAPGK